MSDESPLKCDDDIHLMVKVRDGDRSAYEMVYRRHFRMVVSFLARRNGRSQECEDLAQEVFARVWRRRDQYQPLASVKSYLLGVAANVVRETHARNRRSIEADTECLGTMRDDRRLSPSVQAQSREQLQAVRALMMRLPRLQRQAVELVYLVGLSPEQAAQRLGCSANVLQVHLCRARQTLRKITGHLR